MTDRVPGAPGQYKAVIAEAELQKMQTGEQFVITMTRDDQPIVEGTPYSKAAVLPDELAQSLCPGVEDPTPADAFLALHHKAVESSQYPGCYYRTVDGVTEWINPPMDVGVEYRTTERWNGKAVYTMLFDFGAMPTKGTVKEVVFSDDETISRVIRCSATSHADVTHTYPAYSEGTILFFATERRSVICDNHTNWGMQYFSAQIQVWYVKN